MKDENAGSELRQAVNVVLEHLDAPVAPNLLISGPWLTFRLILNMSSRTLFPLSHFANTGIRFVSTYGWWSELRCLQLR